jgi:hypothetical protein
MEILANWKKFVTLDKIFVVNLFLVHKIKIGVLTIILILGE